MPLARPVAAQSWPDRPLRTRMAEMGNDIVPPAMTAPEAFGRFLRADLERPRRAVQLAGLTPE